jgi:hypothetical protein
LVVLSLAKKLQILQIVGWIGEECGGEETLIRPSPLPHVRILK